MSLWKLARTRRRSWGLAVAAAALGLLVTITLQAILGYPSFLILVPAVMFSALAGGAEAGIVTTAIALVVMNVLMAPPGALVSTLPVDIGRTLTFVGVAAMLIVLGHRYRRLGEALRASEAEFRGLFELAGAGLAVADPSDTRLTRVNAAFCELTGYSREELLTMSAMDLTHPDDRDADLTAVRRVVRGISPSWRSEKRYIRRDGRVIWVLVHGTSIRDRNGRALCTVANVVDITVRKEAEARLQHAHQMKDEFLANLSHELRTPVNVIAGWCRMLLSDFREPQRVERGLRVITRNTEGVSRVIEDLLSVSSIITGRMRLNAEPVDLNDVLRGVIESVSVAAVTKRIRLIADTATVPLIVGDRVRISQIAWNLLSNALKFTPADGTITISLGAEETGVTLCVADTGVGISPEFLPHVFEKFRQEDTSITREHAGLGLGLTIVKQLVELHGGTIDVHSDGRDRGARFTVKFPILNAASPLAVETPFGSVSA